MRPLLSHGWRARLDLTKPPPEWCIFFDENSDECEPFYFEPGSRLFSDGSSLCPRVVWSLARAGCAVVQVDDDGRLFRGLYCGLPFTLSQAAVSGERAGAVLATVFSEDALNMTEIFVDCIAHRGEPSRFLARSVFRGISGGR